MHITHFGSKRQGEHSLFLYKALHGFVYDVTWRRSKDVDAQLVQLIPVLSSCRPREPRDSIPLGNTIYVEDKRRSQEGHEAAQSMRHHNYLAVLVFHSTLRKIRRILLLSKSSCSVTRNTFGFERAQGT